MPHNRDDNDMTTQDPDPGDREHQAMTELIPWYLNETLDETTRSRLDRHLATCSRCRADVAFERTVQGSLAAQRAVEYLPAGSLKRLNATLDELQPAKSPDSFSALRRPLRLAVAASIALLTLTVGLGVVNVGRLVLAGGKESADYHTVTTSRVRSPDETIRAVFAPAMTVAELQSVLDDAQLRIVAGPSEAGVYSLAPTSTRPASSSLERLRQHAGVRFAESSQP
jgi:anti-sigma factor RsiW